MKLFEKTTVESQTLKNTIAMAPMTRSRADLLYYTQRASAGLIITEGINISEDALGASVTSHRFRVKKKGFLLCAN